MALAKEHLAHNSYLDYLMVLTAKMATDFGLTLCFSMTSKNLY
jgi:hypothetical protein